MSPQVSLLSGLIWLCVNQWCHCRLVCDNGKENLTTDLPEPEELICQELWPQSQIDIPDIDTKYVRTGAVYICMDTPITYHDVIPTHGPYRPVEAESGEYLYCPPQRWLHNLKNGALVLLYHPCVSAEARRNLAVLARSCLAHYILTPHPWLSRRRPLAVVSWGRSLETSLISSGFCDWLVSNSYNVSQFSTNQRTKYSLYLTKPAPLDRPMNIKQEMSNGEELKNCCLEALHLNDVQRTRRRSRKTRMALKQTSQEVTEKVKPNKLNAIESSKQNVTDKLSQNNTKEMTSLLLFTVNVTQSPNSSKYFQEPGGVSKEQTDAEKQLVQNNVERNKHQTDRKPHMKTTIESRRHRIKTDTKAQRTQSECADLTKCGVPESPHIGGPLRGERIPIQRTDEAAWAAAALGFLLVLLILSVLHSRLYRHCRSSNSLYWPEGQQDYESVGDIIRRRLRMVGRRRRRCNYNRRQESALLSNSSAEENSE
ncbi:tumor protein p53-inducible protein 13 [Triplophysa dalaica]|uniref:tumor protein p53-inducible protein 13 n=1 Tax=Triplophysa dalaica TaxID=1582913 RepID=UPI0024DFDD93|nr:tumor protein p53-inducible protein 13 [Triplophysa dalaica]